MIKVSSLFAAIKKNKKAKKSSKNKKRKSRKSKRRKGSRLSKRKRFKYKRGGPDIRVITKESQFNDVPDNGVMPVERQQFIEGSIPSELGD